MSNEEWIQKEIGDILQTIDEGEICVAMDALAEVAQAVMRHNAGWSKAVDKLAEELSSVHDACPFYCDDGEGCPRPGENYNLKHYNQPCDKSDRRGRKGVECWRLWALGKKEAGPDGG